MIAKLFIKKFKIEVKLKSLVLGISMVNKSISTEGCDDIQYNETRYDATQHNNNNVTFCIKNLSTMRLSVRD